MTVTLRNFEMIAGTAVPLSGLTVVYMEASLTHPNTNPALGTTTTNVSGMWEFVDVPDGTYDVMVDWAAEGKEKWYKGNCAFSFISDIPASAVYDNPIINGGFNVWQRGTSFPAIASGAYSADRWIYANSSSAVHTISRSTDVPAVSGIHPFQNYSILVDCTTADASIAAGDFAVLQQRIEGYNALSIVQRQFTLSFWVKATKTGTYCVAFRSAGNLTNCRSYIGEYTVTSTATWEYKTITVSASPTSGTWDYTNGIGMIVSFALSCGSTYQTAAGEWQSNDYFGTSNQVNATDSIANDFRLSQVRITPGGSASPFAPRQAGTELELCQRYLYVIGQRANFEYISQGGFCNATTTAEYAIEFPVEMRGVPSVSFAGVTDFQVVTGTTIIATTDVTSTVLAATTTQRAGIKATVASGLTIGQGVLLRTQNGGTAKIIYTAEL